MSSLLQRASLNFLRRHPWQLGLAIVGITLGVAVVIAIDLALESSFQSFERAGKAVSGQATHRIFAADGGLEEELYTRLRVESGIQNLSPVIQGLVTSNRDPEQHFSLFGIDPLIEKTFHTTWQSRPMEDRRPPYLPRLITETNSALISRGTARRLQLNVNDRLAISSYGLERQLTIIGFFDADNAVSKQALNNLIITDIASAQEILGRYGKLSYIEVIINNVKEQARALENIRAALPADVLLISTLSRGQAMRQMTRAFSINLTALGLLSLLVGMFLIYNTMTFLVIQRLPLIASLRCIGVTRRQIFKLIINEALLLAAGGTVVGIIVGIIIGQGLLQLVSGTVDSIFFRIDAANLLISPIQIGKALLLGFGATILAVLPPAWEATRQAPHTVHSRSQLESGSRRLVRSSAAISLLLLLGGVWLAQLSDTSISLGLASIFLLLFAFALMTPAITVVLMRLLEKPSGALFGILGKLPVRLVAAEISRTGIAIAALMIAVAATIGIDLMIGSFRETVSQWVKASLQADFYVSVSGDNEALDKASADHTLKAALGSLADVALLSSVLHTQVQIEQQLTGLSVFELNALSKNGFLFKARQPGDIWQKFATQQSLFVTEPYAYHNDIKIGQSLKLQTESGIQDFEVIAVYADYSGDRGHLAMHRNQYHRHWPDLGYTGIGIYAHKHADLSQLGQTIQKHIAPYQQALSDYAIYQASMEVFNKTFSVTETLRWLAAGIAFIGVFSALMALQFERTRQLGILRAIGITPRQLATLITTETGLMGLVAGLLAIPVGYLVAYILIFVIYQRSFGWTMTFHDNPTILLQGLLLALLAALLAGILPALKMSRTHPAEALRTE